MARPSLPDDDLDAARAWQWRATLAALAVCAVQVFAASRLDLMFDEAYYRRWADHLSFGYFDHPPLVAVWIKLSTLLFGDSDLGMRLLGILATLSGVFAIQVIARDLFDDPRRSALSALLWTATPLLGVGAILVTPDTPLLVGWTTALWALARLHRTGNWRWWLVVGAAAGLALEAKYTALFLGPGIVLAMTVLPEWRRWWRHPAPYVGGLIALALFAPNILWNARNGWQTFAKQFGRAGDIEWTYHYVFEFLGSQLGLLNPFTFALSALGLWLAARGPSDAHTQARRLLACLVAPLLVYFLTHSLHDRVQGNWMAPLYPALILLAADAALSALHLPGRAAEFAKVARAWAWPTGLGMIALAYVQALFTPLPLTPKSDPTALVAGWRGLSRELDQIAAREGATAILTPSYALTSLLARYSEGTRPVLQYNDRIRWAYRGPQAEPKAPILFLLEARRADAHTLLDRFEETREIARLNRIRNGTTLETYAVWRANKPRRPILDPLPQLNK